MWNIHTGPHAVTLSIALAGDYNHNGIVDAADYTIWRDTLGSTSDLRADGDSNGVVNAADYSVWKMSFGASGARRCSQFCAPFTVRTGTSDSTRVAQLASDTCNLSCAFC